MYCAIFICKMTKTKVTQKGQTVVPASIRKEWGIDRNTTLVWTSDGKVITVIPSPEDPIGQLRGYTEGKSLRAALIRKRKEDVEKG